MIKEITLSTKFRDELIDITGEVQDFVTESTIDSGILRVFIPHTTAAVTINENADPTVKRDILKTLDRIVPRNADYQHSEGNSAAHIKSTIVGTDKTVFIKNGSLMLGTWQGIFFCEFDGPRQRSAMMSVEPFGPGAK